MHTIIYGHVDDLPVAPATSGAPKETPMEPRLARDVQSAREILGDHTVAAGRANREG